MGGGGGAPPKTLKSPVFSFICQDFGLIFNVSYVIINKRGSDAVIFGTGLHIGAAAFMRVPSFSFGMTRVKSMNLWKQKEVLCS